MANNGQQQQAQVQQPQVVYVQQPQQTNPIGGVIELLSIGIGLAAGFGAGSLVGKLLPEAVSTMDKVVRTATIYGTGIAVQKLVSDAILDDYREVVDLTGQAVLAARTGKPVQQLVAPATK